MWEKEDEIHFTKFKIKEIVASLKMPLSELEIVGSLTDDEKIRLAELLGEDNSENNTDWIFAESDDNQSGDSENESELDRTISESVFALDSNFDNYQGYNEKVASGITVECTLEENEGDDDDEDREDNDGVEVDDDDDDNNNVIEDDDDGIESLDNTSHNSIDSENYNPYNTDPELLSRLDQIDDKLKKLNSDYSKTMEDFVRFQENDFDLKARLKDIDDSLKKLSCDNSALFYFDQNPETTSYDIENQEACNPDSQQNKEAIINVDNEDIFNINYGEACDCSENWANVKKKYDLQIHKIEDMLEKLCETNDKNFCMKNEEELRERGNRVAGNEID